MIQSVNFEQGKPKIFFQFPPILINEAFFGKVEEGPSYLDRGKNKKGSVAPFFAR